MPIVFEEIPLAVEVSVPGLPLLALSPPSPLSLIPGVIQPPNLPVIPSEEVPGLAIKVPIPGLPLLALSIPLVLPGVPEILKLAQLPTITIFVPTATVKLA